MKFFTKEWYQLMGDWANHKLVEQTVSEYEDYFKDAFKEVNPRIVQIAKNIDFHDCKITTVTQSEHYLEILLDNSGAFTDVHAIQFDYYKIIKQDFSIENSWWLYEEIYLIDGRYELHVLLHNHNCSETGEFIISAEHISLTV